MRHAPCAMRQWGANRHMSRQPASHACRPFPPFPRYDFVCAISRDALFARRGVTLNLGPDESVRSAAARAGVRTAYVAEGKEAFDRWAGGCLQDAGVYMYSSTCTTRLSTVLYCTVLQWN